MTRETVPAHETGVVRLFSIDLPEDEVARFAEAPQRTNGAGDWPLKDALGAEHLDPGHVEVLDVGDVAALGLSTYLTEGLGIPEEEVARQEARIDAVRGHVAVITSGAFGGRTQTLDPSPPLKHIGTFREQPPQPVIGSIESEAAKTRTEASGSGRGRLASRGRPVKHARTSPVLTIVVILLALAVGLGIVLAMASSFT